MVRCSGLTAHIGGELAIAWEQYRDIARQRDREAERSQIRLDIQGLRMVAVLMVFACHLWRWPPGGFVGVDVFFVISGFLITGNLLRKAEATGTVAFRTFYWNRVRRIVPAATVILLLICLASFLVFQPFRARDIGIDALSAFVFMSNWRFAVEGTDYFAAAAQTVSPVQHYWSLSIEEQFYFVWPALIFVISAAILRRRWPQRYGTQLAAGVFGVVVSASFGWALHTTADNATWAYFDTFARVWELGVGALLAIGVGVLARIPRTIKPVLSWLGLGLITASLFLIAEGSLGFPAPWAALPVTGAALVIAAGVGGEPSYQQFLRNPISTYIGDISYSLYLVHWPVIVLLAAVMNAGPAFDICVLALAFAAAIAAYHFVENPLRRTDRATLTSRIAQFRRREFTIGRTTKLAGLASGTLLVVALAAVAAQPPTPHTNVAVPALGPANAVDHEAGPTASEEAGPPLGPLATALQSEIRDALKATDWPDLVPSMEAVITGPRAAPEVEDCGSPEVIPGDDCTWGSPDAPTKIVLVGDSVALAYATPLRLIALNSNGQIQVHSETLAGCEFADDLIDNPDAGVMDACPARKQRAIDVINATRPSVVVVSNSYGEKRIDQRVVDTPDWVGSVQRILAKITTPTKIVMLAAPPADVNIAECFAHRGVTPADCISKVTGLWNTMADAGQQTATATGGVWMDSRTWFCNDQLCPAFVGVTPTKRDTPHMAPAYGEKIAPVIAESFREAGILPS